MHFEISLQMLVQTYATAIPQSKTQFTSYLQNCPKCNSNSMFMTQSMQVRSGK